MTTDTLYERDFALWTEQQGEELRRAAREGSNLPLDWENLAEEIETLGRSQRSQRGSLVRQIMTRLIKLAYSPTSPNWFGWESEINLFRDQLERLLDDSPSLRPGLAEAVSREMPRAKRIAVSTLCKFGEMEAAAAVEGTTFSFTADQVLDEDWFLPGTYDRVRKELKSEP
jgi:uncharacterized protein DUF29